MRIKMGYPSHETEKEILRKRVGDNPLDSLDSIADVRDVMGMQHAVAHVKVDSSLHDYAIEIVNRTRKSEQLALGVSPRGTLMLQRAAQARAFLDGRDYCLPDDFKQLAVSVFSHRVVARSRHASLQKEAVSTASALRGIVHCVAALNTGNNLLFLMLARLIALLLMSGIPSSITLSGISLRLVLPEHIFAGQPVRAMVELENEKLILPSFSLRVEAAKTKNAQPVALLDTPVYFPYLPKQDRVQQTIPVTFPHRGVYLQEAFRIVTRFPFGFLRKSRQLNLKTQALVYPSVEPNPEYMEILTGVQGALESLTKGPGQDLYALRGYVPTDSARHVHWKASARSGSLMVREFTRENDCRILLVLDPHLAEEEFSRLNQGVTATSEHFERTITICASLAWHFYDTNSLLEFRCSGVDSHLYSAVSLYSSLIIHPHIQRPMLLAAVLY